MPSEDVRLLEWRIKTLEAIEKAMREELHDVRTRVPDLMLKALREDYYTKAEARNVFVTRRETSEAGERHRQWPLIVCGVVMGVLSVTDFVLRLTGAS